MNKQSKFIKVDVAGPEELTEGIYRFTLTHPLLDGKLTFIQENADPTAMIEALTPSWQDEIINTIGLVTEVGKTLDTKRVKKEKGIK